MPEIGEFLRKIEEEIDFYYERIKKAEREGEWEAMCYYQGVVFGLRRARVMISSLRGSGK